MNKIRLIESLKEIIGYQIGVYFIDGGYADGILVDVKNDFLTLKYDTDETFFLSVDKIQAFSKNTKKFEVKETNHGTTHAPSLMDVIDHYKYEWVTINCHNYLSFSGVLSIIAKDYVILTDKEYKLYIQRSQIISFFPENLKVVEEKKETKQESKQEAKQQDKKKESESKKKNEQETNKKEVEETKEQKENKEAVTASKDSKEDSNAEEKKASAPKSSSPDENNSNKQKSSNVQEKKQNDHKTTNHDQKKSSDKNNSDDEDKKEHLNKTLMKLFKENFSKTEDSKTTENSSTRKENKQESTTPSQKTSQKTESKSKKKQERKNNVAWLGADNTPKGKSYFGIPYKYKKKKQAK